MNIEKTDIVIPTWNHPGQTITCFKSIFRHTKSPYRIIWVDDGSTEKNYFRVLNVAKSMEISLVNLRSVINQGPTMAINLGLRASISPYIAIVNNDVQVTEGWLGKLLQTIKADSKIGIISAVGNGGGRADWKKWTYRLNSMIEGNLEKSFNSHRDEVFEIRGNIPFFCCILSRVAIEKIGYLDESMRIYASDDDFNERLKMAGFKKMVKINCFVYHDHRATVGGIKGIMEIHKKDRRALIQARERRKKWNQKTLEI